MAERTFIDDIKDRRVAEMDCFAVAVPVNESSGARSAVAIGNAWNDVRDLLGEVDLLRAEIAASRVREHRAMDRESDYRDLAYLAYDLVRSSRPHAVAAVENAPTDIAKGIRAGVCERIDFWLTAWTRAFDASHGVASGSAT